MAIYHDGEIEVQSRAGVREMANRIGRSIGSIIPLAAQEFLRRQPMIIIGSLDGDGRVWASLLTGEQGFMQIRDERTLRINAVPVNGDPLTDNIKVNVQVGILAIEPAMRRRMRLNGKAELTSDHAILVHAEQVFSNCPKYIQAREWEIKDDAASPSKNVLSDTKLNAEQQHFINTADTFFIASSHKEGGVDASHRGGNPGFIHVANESLLVFPDYSGNMMFQTLGNITANPNAGLLFIDFKLGTTLQLTGRAKIFWDAEHTAKFVGAERVVEFQIDKVVEIDNATRLRWSFLDYSPFNPKQ